MNADRITISDMPTLAAATRTLLGYTPRERVVVIVLTPTSSIYCTAAVELTPLLADQIIPGFDRFDGMNLLVFGFSANEDDARNAAERIMDLMPNSPVVVMTVSGGLLRTYDDGTCVNVETMVAWEDTTIASHGVLAGKVTDDNREDLIARLDTCDPRDAHRTAELLAIHTQTPRDYTDLYPAIVSGSTLTPEDAATAYVTLAQPKSYREALSSMTPEDAMLHFDFWRQVAMLTQHADNARPLGIAGVAGWLAGDGIRAIWAMERAEREGTREPICRVLDHLTTEAVNPQEWPHIRAALLA